MIHLVITRLASRLKDVNFHVDPQFPATYLARWIILRAVMAVTGIIRFRTIYGMPFVAPSARLISKRRISVGKSVTLSERCYIDAESTGGVELGDGSSIGPRTRVECVGSISHYGRGIAVGRHSSLGADCFYGCAGGIQIGSEVLVGNFVSFHSENHLFESVDKSIRAQGVTHEGISVGDNCWIGAGSIILDGARIGDGCVIAAGSVVAGGTYKSNAVYGGVPAKLLKNRVSPDRS